MSNNRGRGRGYNNRGHNKKNYSKGDIRHYSAKNSNNKHSHKKGTQFTVTEVIVVEEPSIITTGIQKIKEKITGNNNNNNNNKNQHNSHNKYNNKQNTNNKSNSHHSSPSYDKKSNFQPNKYSNNQKHSSPPNTGNYNSDSSNLSMGSSASSSSSQSNAHKLYPLPCKSGQRWQQIVTVLTKPMNNCTDLIKALYQLAGEKQKSQLCCKGLAALLTNCMTVNDQKIFYQVTLPFIIQSALNLPALFPNREISLLYEGDNSTVELTEDQVCSLLAMSFFGLNTWERKGSYFPRFDITNLFGYLESVYFEKLKCILHYFYILATTNRNKKNNTNSSTSKVRTLSIYRHLPQQHEYTALRNEHLKNNVTPLCRFEFKLSGSIEECANCLQIDFANKYIGGGVLGSGCVQEEIRFLINTECLVSLLLCQCMKSNEAIAVVGTKQFAKYKGYGSSFEFNGNYNDQTRTKEYGKYYKHRNCIVAIDAEKFYHNQLWQQYKENKMKRELLKCYTGFSIPTAETHLDESLENDKKLWIATGNWGCGVFGGDIELKCIIQWMAASMAGRKIKYFAFGDKGCKYIASFIEIVAKNNITVGMLWRYLCDYAQYRRNAYQHNPNSIMSVFQYIVRQINHGTTSTKWQLIAHSGLEKKKKYLNVSSLQEKKENFNKSNDNMRKKVDVDKNKNETPGHVNFFDVDDVDDMDVASDASSTGLQADYVDVKKKTSMQKPEIQNSNADDTKGRNTKVRTSITDDEDDADCTMTQK